ncbi:MAG: N-formylglutamate amidohydrolase [Planctomycetaceae bacterium]|nr:N-formylglutamate amidohydrolase [Planctomycetaceae bacterium]
MTRFTRLGFVLAILDWSTFLAAAEPPLVTVIQGDLPIVLSAPHGGREVVPEVPIRVGRGTTQFVTVRDDNTAELTDKVAALLEQRLKRKPFVVLARFERKFIDVNRPAEHAYESSLAKPHYDAYHAALAEACRTVLNRWQRGLLIDVHGQTLEDDTIFRGTNNRHSVTRLLERSGEAALSGEHSVCGVLAQRGYAIFPPGASRDAEHPRYNGGHIIRTCGSHVAAGLDAIQLEFGTNLRRRSVLDKTAEDTAAAIAEFAQEYLPTKQAAEGKTD